MFKGALFDMDGLMIDTEIVSLQCWVETAKFFHVHMEDEEIARRAARFRGRNRLAAAAVYKEVFPGNIDYQAFMAKKYEFMDKALAGDGLRKKEGLDDLLKFLKCEGIKMAVATSTQRQRAESYLNRLGIDGYFEKFICGDEVKNGKPEPDIYIAAAEALGLKPTDCVGFEDSPVGIRALAAAGCFAVAVPDMDPIDGEVRSLCGAVCKDLREAITVVKEHF